MENTRTQTKYQQLIYTAQSIGISKLHVRELNNILYIDGDVPDEVVKQELWDIYHRIDPGYRSGDLVLNLRVYQQAG